MKMFYFSESEVRGIIGRTRRLRLENDLLRRRLEEEELVANAALHDLGQLREEQNIPRFIEHYRRGTLENGRSALMGGK